MQHRIEEIQRRVLAGEMWFETTQTEYDRLDLLLDPVEMSAKRAYEYILNQNPMIPEDFAMAGFLRFDGSVEGDAFNRPGHKGFSEFIRHFYLKDIDNLFVGEWQHSVADFSRVIDIGIEGVKELIAQSLAEHTAKDEQIFLRGLNTICNAIIGWAEKCAAQALKVAAETENAEYRQNLTRMAATLRKVPRSPAENFREAMQSLYLCYPFIPDSIGLPDRYLYRFYRQEVADGVLTREEAKTLLQELFLMIQARTHIKSSNFCRGGESHFCVGGYLPDGTDGFNDLSRLIVESLMELSVYAPQITLRWTKKTPHEVLRFMMDCERHDPNKRIAFVNDEPRIKAFTENIGFTWEQAVGYCMTGCNEPALPGGRIMGAGMQNVLRSMANTFKNRGAELVQAATFDDFYAIYEQELFADMAEMLRLDGALNALMARDCNLVSSIFFAGSIETAKSLTQGGAALATAVLDFNGHVSVIDSLAIVRQFVYDEKRVSMQTLVDAVNANWVGYEDLRSEILRCGKYFGNDDEETNEAARRFTDSLYRFLQDKTNLFGKRFIIGSLIGYHQHNKWFGSKTAATPDGRHDGDAMSFGSGQGDGRDRKGLTALLNSVAKCDPHCILTGPSVTNVLLDEQILRNDDQFEKLVHLFEAYFRMGGTHFQLNYVSKDDLLCAQKQPEQYRSLRVRVSGFSDFFVNLNGDLQDEVIARTVKEG